MNRSFGDLMYGVGEKTIAYLPSLIGGLVLIAIGAILGWIVKRVVAQSCRILHVDRVLRSFRWGAGFAKADVRLAFYDAIGSFAAFVIFLVFLNAGLAAMQLTILSDLLEQGVWFIPKLVIALVIFALGLTIAGVASSAMLRALRREEVPRASLVSRFAKLVLVIFFSAMALTELGIAREIVIIGFTATIVTTCLITILLLALAGRGVAAKILDRMDEE
ncbi:MAG: hypothetical protein U0167_10725 [bacterium]